MNTLKKNNNFFIFKNFFNTIILVVIIAIFTLPINVFAKDNKPIHCVDRDDKKISLTFDVNGQKMIIYMKF